MRVGDEVVGSSVLAQCSRSSCSTLQFCRMNLRWHSLLLNCCTSRETGAYKADVNVLFSATLQQFALDGGTGLTGIDSTAEGICHEAVCWVFQLLQKPFPAAAHRSCSSRSFGTTQEGQLRRMDNVDKVLKKISASSLWQRVVLACRYAFMHARVCLCMYTYIYTHTHMHMHMHRTCDLLSCP